jgi:two-component system, NtrC family, nitrogen regulation response regulator NtrX
MAGEHVLVVDDEVRIRETLSTVLEDEGYQVTLASSGEEALELAARQVPNMVLLDIWMPGLDGLETLQRLKEAHPALPVIIISGHGTIETAVRATQLGAYDFVEKPLILDKLLLTIGHALERESLTRRYEVLRSREDKRYQIVGQSPVVRGLLRLIETAAPSNARVLISGENGTGKELVARAIHRLSQYSRGPFVEVNCAAIPEELIESEMFGHEKGAFTGAAKMKRGKFELAHGGTIFLDEIGDMSLKTQAKVLRVLEEKTIERVGGDRTIKVDVRVIAASNKNLPEQIERGDFREDLYYRLNVIEIYVPSLAERIEDVPLLAEHFLKFFAEEYGKRPQSLHPDTLALLMKHPWPGNIRELRNIIERLVILSRSEVIQPEELPPSFRESQEVHPFSLRECESLKEAREDFERQYILWQLKRNDFNVTHTAEALKIERTNLHRKLKALGIQTPGQQRSEGTATEE